MELLIILYLFYVNLLSPSENHHKVGWGLDRNDARVIAWEKSIQKYEKKRVEISEAERQALRAIYRDIQVAYTNNQVEAMKQAMACVSNRVDYIHDSLYRELAGGIEDLFWVRFLAANRQKDFDSPVEFARFLDLHTRMAFFLGDCHCRRNNYGQAPIQWIEYSTFEGLKRYVDSFRNEERDDLRDVAQKYLDKWIAHIESPNGFIRRYAHWNLEMSWPGIELGKITPEQARQSSLGCATPLIRLGYTPKWLEEFK